MLLAVLLLLTCTVQHVMVEKISRSTRQGSVVSPASTTWAHQHLSSLLVGGIPRGETVVRMLALEFESSEELSALRLQFPKKKNVNVIGISSKKSLCKEKRSSSGRRGLTTYCPKKYGVNSLFEASERDRLQPFEFDIILDSGVDAFNIARFQIFFKKLLPGGVYAIRLTSQSVRPRFGDTSNMPPLALPDIYYGCKFEANRTDTLLYFYHMIDILNRYTDSQHLRSILPGDIYFFRWIESLDIRSGIVIARKRFTPRSFGFMGDADEDAASETEHCTVTNDKVRELLSEVELPNIIGLSTVSVHK